MESLVDMFRAWRRGDHRVAPAGTRGRVYERKDSEPSPVMAAAARGRGSVTPSRVYRADLDKWFDLVYNEKTGAWEEVDNG